MEPVKYVNEMQIYQRQQSVEANCAEIFFLNQGTARVFLNKVVTLEPTQSISFDGKTGEMDITRYQLTFGVSGTKECVVIRKLYVDYKTINI